MAVSVAIFRTRFPEFADRIEFPDERIQLFIDDAVLRMGTNENRWQNKYDYAQAYLVAHFLALAEQTEAGDAGSKVGAIQSKTAGGVSVTRSSSPGTDSADSNYLLSTAYGQKYDIIRRSCFVGVSVGVC